QVERTLGAPVDSLAAVACLGGDAQVRRRVDHQLQTLAHQSLVLCQEDRGRFQRLDPVCSAVIRMAVGVATVLIGRHAFTGNVPRTKKVLVPSRTSSSPPDASTLSLMVVSPNPGCNVGVRGRRSFSTSNRTTRPAGTSTFTLARRAAPCRMAWVSAACTAR